MTAPRASAVFDPDVLEQALRRDPAATLVEMARYISTGQITLRLRNLQGVGSTDPEREHFLLSFDLGVRVFETTDPNEQQLLTREQRQAVIDLLEGRGLGAGVKRCREQ